MPEAVFEQYLSVANKLGQDITSSGLLRLAQMMSNGKPTRARNGSSVPNPPA